MRYRNRWLAGVIGGLVWVLIWGGAQGCTRGSGPTAPTDGVPVPGGDVNLYGRVATWIDAQGAPLRPAGTVSVQEIGMKTVIADDGQFRFDPVPPGRWTLVFRHPDGAQATLVLEMHAPGEVHIVVRIQGSICTVEERREHHGEEGELHGMVTAVGNGQFTMQAVGERFTVRYTSTTVWEGLRGPQDLYVGLHLEAEGRWLDDRTLDAERVASMSDHDQQGPNRHWCGMIMDVGDGWFWMHGTQIYYDMNTRFVGLDGPQDLRVGRVVEVDVVWRSDHWYARTIARADRCMM